MRTFPFGPQGSLQGRNGGASPWQRGFVGVLLPLALSSLFTASAHAQQTGRIVGRVTEAESGAPIGGAQVFLPETRIGSLSRQNGAFVILQVPAGTHEIRVERIGLTTVSREITVTAGEAVVENFEITTEALGLDEIVVTGTAGSARRREIGNTIAQVRLADIPVRPVDVSNMLMSVVPGLSVQMGGGGGMGMGNVIKLRGNRSVFMGNSPIFYVDGIRMQSTNFPGPGGLGGINSNGANLISSPLNNINPNDIERIEIIKGAAATTLYGTEASSGVIQIITKRGAAGAPVWNVETSQGFSRAFKIGSMLPTQEQRDLFPYLRMGPYLETGYLGDYSASVRGGAEALQYFISAGLTSGVGITPSDSITKHNVRGNFTFTPQPDVQLQFNSAYSREWVRNTGGSTVVGLVHSVYRGVAGYTSTEDPAVNRQIFDLENTQEIERFMMGGTLTYSPLANQTNRLTVGYDFSQQEKRVHVPYGYFLAGEGAIGTDQFENRLITLDYVGTYNFDVMSGVRSNFSWGGQAASEDQQRLYGQGENFPGVALPTVSSAARRQVLEQRSRVWNAGFFVQNIFDLQDRYFLTLGLRVDGNSAFGTGFGLQTYPKASVSWVLSDEGFWQDGWGSIKLRAAYGRAGRAPRAFDAVRTWFQGGYADEPAVIPDNVGNSDIGPEVTGEFEAGFDAEWLNGRLLSTFTYYNQTTTDALFNVSQAPSNGFSNARRQNLGKVNNKGIELSLNAFPIRSLDWGWEVGVNVTTNHSKVVSLGGFPAFALVGVVGSGSSGSVVDGWAVEGQPVPVMQENYVTNPDEIADPIFESRHIYGPYEPTLTVAPSMTVRGPGGVSLSALAEFNGGHWSADHNHNVGQVRRGAYAPICWPYYQNPYSGKQWNWRSPEDVAAETGRPFSTAIKPDTPALWRARCNPATASPQGTFAVPADNFRIRSISAHVPVDFAFRDRVSSAVLTLSVTEPFRWYHKEWLVMDTEMGVPGRNFRGPSQFLPPTWGGTASLRVQF